jgi:urate oxidase
VSAANTDADRMLVIATDKMAFFMIFPAKLYVCTLTHV